MTSDSTELTFVRCPSCRSLVPAVSTRCRMCGATIDATAKSEESEKDAKKSGRVRQKTMSETDSPLTSAAEELRGEGASDESAEIATGGDKQEIEGSTEEPSEDPLSAYIEEVEVQEEPISEQGSFRDTSRDKRDEKRSGEDSPGSANAASSAGQNGGGKAAYRNEGTADSKPKVILESGQRKQNKPGGLSFGKSKDDRPPADARRATEGGEQRWKPVQDKREQERRPDGSQSQGRRDEVRHDRPADPSRAAREDSQAKPWNRADRTERPQEAAGRPAEMRSETKQTAVSGKLFGWFVNYSDPDGIATELREGKFFVTRSRLKENDFIIDRDSISTPHALISVSNEGGFQLQDLMSDKGVYVRRKGSGSFERAPDRIKVEHGDWIRFGEVELLLCLVAHVGVK